MHAYILKCMRTYSQPARQIIIHTGIQRDTYIFWRTYINTGRHIRRHTYTHTCIHTGRHTN